MSWQAKNNLLVVSQATTGLMVVVSYLGLCTPGGNELALFALFAGSSLSLYFLCAGERGLFEQIVWLGAAVNTALAAYWFVRALRPSLPGGYVDMVGVVGSIPLVILQSGAVMGVLVKSSLLRTAGPAVTPPHCRTCGYNLTGNISGVCPECGERI